MAAVLEARIFCNAADKRPIMDSGSYTSRFVYHDLCRAAEPKSSPLHSRFEWDNSKAGHQYRIWQARQLIRVSVEVRLGMDEPTSVFVSLTQDRLPASRGLDDFGGGYRIMADVMSDKPMREQLLVDALAELETFRDKYKTLKELAVVFSAIKKVSRK